MKRLTTSLFILTSSLLSFAQESIDTSVLNKIKDEGLNHSQVDRIAHYLIDVAGPRLTNSPGYIKASTWAVSELKNWGLADAHLDSWGKFGPGWSMQKNYVAIKKTLLPNHDCLSQRMDKRNKWINICRRRNYRGPER